ncbi:MAG: UDP-2,3-diacylglucosamine diphosphatase [Methylophaga sp.]
MRRLFISDLHLSPSAPELIRLASEFLQSQQDQIDEVYILGDIFNTWLGDDIVPTAFDPFINALKTLSSSGISLFLMVGNRDFMLGQTFASLVGATLLSDNHEIRIGNHRALLMHGDTLCIDDVSYQRYRRVVRNRFLQWCFRRLPAGLRQAISDRIIAKSRQKKQHKPAMIMDVNHAEVQRVISSHKVTLLIHGHTHRPAIHALTNREGNMTYRIVLGDWDHKISYLLADDQQLTLHDHRLEAGQQSLGLT